MKHNSGQIYFHQLFKVTNYGIKAMNNFKFETNFAGKKNIDSSITLSPGWDRPTFIAIVPRFSYQVNHTIKPDLDPLQIDWFLVIVYICNCLFGL